MDIQATQLRAGMLIKFNGDLMSVHRMEHRTPGNLRGFVRAWMRNLRTGALIENRFSSEDLIERAAMDPQEMEYLYEDGDHYHFMNTDTFEQIAISKEQLGGQVNYLLPNTRVTVQFYEGAPFSIDLPQTMDLEVVETEPAIKGATVNNVNKPAKTETGLIVQVPPFIKEGERIRVNTGDGSYMGRAT